MEKTLFIIFNPQASKGKAIKKLNYIKKYLDQKKISFIIKLTEHKDHAISIAKQAAIDGHKNIIAAGGDGTINEIVNGIISSKVPDIKLGIIPIGRGNDICWSFNLPLKIKHAIDSIEKNCTKKVDLILFKGGKYPEGRYLVNAGGIGFEALINEYASKIKYLNGLLSYVCAFIKILTENVKPAIVDILIDEKEYKSLYCQELCACNGKRLGGAFIMGPNAKFDDGFLDLLLANNHYKGFNLIKLALKFFLGKQEKDKDVTILKCKKVKIQSRDNDLIIQADGENYGSSCAHCSFEIIENALKIF